MNIIFTGLIAGSIGCSVVTMDAQTNQVNADILSPLINTNYSYSFWTTLGTKMDKTSRNAAFDRFGPTMYLSNFKITEKLGYKGIDYMNSAGEEVMQKTAVNGLRETLADLPATKEWKNWMEDLWVGTFGNTAEEDVGRGLAVPTESEKTWWQKMKSNGNFAGGWRLDDPTLYGSARFGHWLNSPALILHARINYRPLNKTRAEINAIVPMPFGEISGGISLELLRSDNKSMVSYFRFSHGLLHSNSMFWFAGVNYYHQNKALLFQAGFNMNL